MSRLTTAAHVVRGGLIGAAEVVPGISGGTIALVTGVYEALIRSAGHFVGAARAALTDRPRARQELAQVHWGVVAPVLLGMVPMVLLSARVLAPLVEDHPIPMFGLFLGMTAAAVLVPIAMIGSRWRAVEVLLAAAVATATFVVVGLPPQELNPTPPVIFLAAAIAVCALAMPGMSGSFLLLTFGLYTPTLNALNERDYGYVAVFVSGMVVGLALFVRFLQWLLEHRRRVTLVVMTGVMVGALRALWPWQSEERDLQAPGDELGLTLLLVGVGAAVVLGLYAVARRVSEDDPDLQEIEHEVELGLTDHDGPMPRRVDTPWPPSRD